MLANFIQYNTSDPINSPELKKLIENTHQGTVNESITKVVREMDLLARKAHFTSLAFQNYGAFLLLGSFCIMLLALKFMLDLNKPA